MYTFTYTTKYIHIVNNFGIALIKLYYIVGMCCEIGNCFLFMGLSIKIWTMNLGLAGRMSMRKFCYAKTKQLVKYIGRRDRVFRQEQLKWRDAD